jgi:cytochrome c biogenesis protein CcdA
MNKILLFVFSLFISINLFAQNEIEMADTLRSNGKIFTVVAVCLTILLGLFLYVFIIDRKINKFEKEINKK